jgi:hypothetical protein
MKPDNDEEEKIKIQAMRYLEDKFNDNFERYDTLYDNMRNFGFEYAAKVGEKSQYGIFSIIMMKQNKWLIHTLLINGPWI